MQSFKSLPLATRTLAVVCTLLVLILVFWAGMAVGYREADFSNRWDRHYVEVFGGKSSPFFNMRVPAVGTSVLSNGAAGRVIAVNLPSFAIQDPNHTEKVILLNSSTTIRYLRDLGTTTNLGVGNFVVVLGSPDAQGRIVASYVRIMPPTDATSTRRQ